MPQPGKNADARKTVALLGAFCLYLSTIEYMIPKPLPFMRLGIANLPLMLALDLFPLGTFVLLVCIKILGQALVSGTLFSYIFLFSLAGTAISAAVMYGLRRALGARMSFIGIGAMGALFSNLTQLVLAWVFLFGKSARFIAPPFLAAGVVTGVVLGLFCEYFSGRSRWYAARRIGGRP